MVEGAEQLRLILVIHAGGSHTVGYRVLEIEDNDDGAVTVSKTAMTLAEGESGTYTVVLDDKPAGDVTVDLSHNSSDRFTLSATSLTFTPDNYNTPQTVTVTAADKAFDDGDVTVSIGHRPRGGGYDGVTADSVALTVTDNDDATIALSVDADTGTAGDQDTVGEGAGATEVAVTAAIEGATRLAAAQTVKVTVGSSGSGPGFDAVAPFDIIIPAGAASGAGSFTLTPSADDVDDDDRTLTLSGAVSPATTVTVSSATLTLTDDDTRGVTVSKTALALDESGTGSSASYDVVLASEPTATVTVAVASDNENAATVSPQSLTFTTADWSTAQEVTVTAVDDDVDGPDIRSAAVTHTVSGGDYEGSTAGSVAVSVTEDDAAAIRAPPTLELSEVGTASYQVTLESEPTAAVTIDISSGDTGAATVSPASVTLTSSNWSTGVDVTVTGVADDDTDDETVVVTHAVDAGNSADEYDSAAAATTRVTVEDVPQVTLVLAPATIDEEGSASTSTVTATLDSTSSEATTVTVSAAPVAPAAAGDFTLSGTTLTIAAGSTTSTGTVTIAANDNALDHPNRTLTVSGTAGNSEDVKQPAARTLTIRDDDTASDSFKLTAAPASVDEGASAEITVTAALNAAARAEATEVTLTLGGSAASGTDYTAVTPGALTIAAGETSGEITFTLATTDDTDAAGNENEGNETVTAAGAAAGLSAGQAATVTIVDSRRPHFTSIWGPSAAENQTTAVTVAATDADAPDSVTGYAITDGADQSKFSIDAATGALTFKAAPDFESPGDADTNNSYLVTVEATSGTGGREKTAAQDIAVRVTNVNEAPTVKTAIDDKSVPVGVTREVDASGTFEDEDAEDAVTLTASSSATDKATAAMNADGTTVEVTGVAAGTADITVTATDKGGLTVTDVFQITVAANVAPSFSSSATPSAAENQTAAVTVAADDADNADSVTGYAITGGADRSKFSIEETSGVLTFASAPNYESPTDAADSDGNGAGDNVYEVTVEAISGTGEREKKASQVITVTVTNVNEAPTVATAIADQSVPVDATRDVDASGTFEDEDAGDALTLTASSSATGTATVAMNADGTTVEVTGVAAGTATITVRATDGGSPGLWVEDAFDVTVAANAAPSFTSSATPSAAENQTAVVTVAADDADTADSVTGYAITGGADRSKFSIEETSGVLTFASAPNYESPTDAADSDGNGAGDNVYEVTVEAISGTGEREKKASQVITVTVTNVNEAPTVATAIADQSVPVDATRDVDASGTFEDEDAGDALTLTASSSATGTATVAMNADGTTVEVTGVAAGTATITVRATDGGSPGLWVEDAFDVTVAANAAPSFTSSATPSAAENQTAVVTVAADDADTADDVSGYAITGGADRSLFAINGTTGVLTFRSAPNFEAPGDADTNNSYLVTVEATSGAGERVKTATQAITVTVVDVNEAPTVKTALNDQSVPVGATRDVDASGTFEDPDAGDSVTLTAESSATGTATVTVSGTTVKVTGVAAGTATITVTATDKGGLTVTDPFQVTVAANVPPSFSSSATPSTAENQTAVVTVTADDADNADSVTGYAITGGADRSKFSIDATSGVLTFASAPNYESPGDADTNNAYLVTVEATSGAGEREMKASQSIAVTVTNVNEAPTVKTALGDNFVPVAATREVDASETFTDPDAGDSLTLTASSSATDKAAVAMNADGTTVEVAGVAAGTATITVTATDGGGLTVTNSFDITVRENVPPTIIKPPNVVIGDSPDVWEVEAAENQTAVLTVTGSDDDEADTTISFALSAGDDQASFQIGGTSGVLAFRTAPDFEAPADSDDNNEYHVVVKATSGRGERARAVTRIVYVTVTNVNEAPTVKTALNDQSVPVGATRDVNASATFEDSDAGDSVTLTASSSATGTATVNVDGTTVEVTGVAAGTATITVRATDGGSPGLWVEDTFDVTVAANAAPSFTSSATPSAAENQTAVVTVAADDSDTADTVSGYAITGGADESKFEIDATSGVLTFEAAPNFEAPGDAADSDGNGAGDNVYEVTVEATSGTGERVKKATQSITVTVTNVNEAPTVATAIDDQSVSQDATRNVDASRTFKDPDSGDTLTLTATSSKTDIATVAMNADGETVEVTGVAAGTATITVRATDGGSPGLWVEDTFDVTVAANAAPSFTSSATPSAAENQTAVVTVVATDADSGDDVTGYAITGGADRSKFTLNTSTGALTFKAAPDYEDPGDADKDNVYDVTVEATSGAGERVKKATQSITVTVANVNEAPTVKTALGDQSVPAGATRDVNASGTFEDPDAGDSLTLTAESSATGTATVAVSGTTVKVAGVAAGTATITVRATDGGTPGLWVEDSFDVTVAENVPPSFTSSAAPSAAENQTAVVDVNAADADAADDVSGYAIMGGADQSLFAINGTTGVLAFRSAPDFESPGDADTNNSYLVTVEATSGAGERQMKATQTITVTVTNVNEAPTVKTALGDQSVPVGATRDVNASGTFEDPDAGDAVTLTASSSATGTATVAMNADGTTVEVTGVAAGTATITVTATDKGGLTVTDPFQITVAANAAPSFTSSAAPSAAENQTAVVTVAAADADSADSVTGYAITGGADQSKFTLNTSTGVLTFKAAPDFEAPGDVADGDGNGAGDNVYEVTVEATSGSGEREKKATQDIAVTVTNVDEVIALSVDTDGGTDGEQDTVGEGAGATTVTVTATVQGSTRFGTAQDVTVKVGKSGDAAVEGTDYANVADFTLTIAAGAASGTKTFSLTPTNDVLDESDETLTVEGTHGSATVTADTITIEDNDGAPSTIALSVDTDGGTGGEQDTVGEGAGATTVTVTATVQGSTRFGTAQDVTVKVGKSGDAAVEGTDYANVADFTLTIAAGAASGTKTFSLTPTNDVLDESDETLTVEGTHGSATVTADTITIEDNDGAPSTIALSVDTDGGTGGEQDTVGEEDGATTVTVTATVQGSTRFGTAQDVTVKVGKSGDAAVEGTDYANVADFTLTIAAGAASGTKTFSLTPTNDVLDESDETLTVEGTHGSATVTADTITIEDNDGAPSTIALSVDTDGGTGGEQDTVGEEDGATTVTVTATVQGSTRFGTAQDVTVKVGKSGDAAVEGTDYANVADFTLTIAAGAASGTKTFSLTPTNDVLDESDETLTVEGTHGSATVTADTITIEDNDGAPSTIALSVDTDGGTGGAQDTVGEGAGATTVTVTATVQGSTRFGTAQDVTVKVGKSGDAAVEGTDYANVADFTLTIAAGTASGTKTFSLTPTNDVLDESDETLTVEGTHGSATVTADTITIEDNDGAPSLTLVLTPASIGEDGGKSVVTATLGGPSGAATSITVSAAAVSPTTAGDFTLSANKVLTIAAGQTTSTGVVEITAEDNEVDHPDREVTVSGDATNSQGITGPSDKTLTISDDDTRGVTLSETAATVTEGGTASWTVALASEPTGAVTVTLTGAGSGITVSPTTLSFTTSNWSDVQTVTASAAEDDNAEPETATITHTASGADYGSGVSAPTVTVTSVDNEAAGLVTPASLTVNEGAAQTYRVKLATEPGGAVQVDITSADTNAATVSPSSVTLTDSDWDVGETVTVTAAAYDGGVDKTVNLTHRVNDAQSWDGYDEVADRVLTLTVSANAAPRFTSSATPSAAENQTAAVTVVATDADSGDDVTGYEITGGADQLKFTIDPTSGALTFNDAPDYEAPGDADTDNAYLVTVEATSGTGEREKTASQAITVSVTNVNEAPVVKTAINDQSVPVGAVRDVDASGTFEDPDAGDSLTLTASSSATGTATVAMNADGKTVEVTGVAAGTATITVRATDGGSPGLWVEDAFTVTVAANVPPDFSSTPTPSAAENQTAVVTVTADDADGADSVTGYAITGGADRSLFDLNATTGVLTFEAAPDYEAPGDAADGGGAGDNVYEVTVEATSGTGERVRTARQDIAVTVTNVNEAPTVAKALGDDSVPVAATLEVDASGTFTDPDADDELTLTAASDDTTVATVAMDSDGTTVEVSGVAAGTADITVTAADKGGLQVTDTFAVTVNAAGLDVPPSLSVNEGETETYWVKLTLQPPPGEMVKVEIEPDPVDAATVDPTWVELTAGNWSDGKPVTVTAEEDDNGEDEKVMLIHRVDPDESWDVYDDVPDRETDLTVNDNAPPIFTNDPAPQVPENMTEVATVSAEDEDGDEPISYALTGGADMGRLVIGPSSGVLAFREAPDFEAPTDADTDNVYLVTVEAASGTGEREMKATQDIAVTVADVNEAPTVRKALGDQSVSQGETREVDASGTFEDPDAGDSLTITAASDKTGIATASMKADGTTVAVTGVAAGTATITVTAADKGGLEVSDTFTVAVAAVGLDVPASLKVDEGKTAAYRVRLAAQPPSGEQVVVGIVSNDMGAATVLPASVTLTAANWSAGVPVTVTGVEDEDSADESVTLTHRVDPDKSWDVYDGVAARKTALAVNDDDEANAPPVFTSDAAPDVPENMTEVVTVVATDADGDTPISYALTGGADQSKFSIDAASGVLTFAAAPDFEAPTDADENNVYEVTVEAASGEGGREMKAQQEIAVAVVDANEAPSVPQVSDQEATAGVPFSYEFPASTDPDSGQSVSYTARMADGGALPPWLSLAGRRFAGTPEAAGVFAIEVTARDDGAPPLSASARFTLTVAAAAPAHLKAVIRTIESRHALTIADRVNASIADRSEGAQAGVRLVGHDAGGGEALHGEVLGGEALEATLEQDAWWRSPEERGMADSEAASVERLLESSSFLLSLGDGADAAGTPSLWGRGASANLSEEEAFTWNGDIRGALLGVDAPLGDDALAGLVLSLSSGRFDYEGEGYSGEYRSRMTSVHPWAAWTPAAGLRLWASAGWGSGEIAIDDETSGGHRSDTELRVLSGGMSGPVLERDALAVDLKGEGMFVSVGVGGGDGISADAFEAHRLRLATEARWEHETAPGDLLTPSVAVGLRNDGGAASSVTGAEIGGGIGFASGRVSVEATGRALLAGGDVVERGVGGTFRHEPGYGGRGLTMSMTLGWGASSSGVERLWENGAASLGEDGAATLGESGEDAARSDAEVGYGLAAGRGLLVPYGGVAVGESGAGSYRIGARYSLSQSLAMELEGERSESGNGFTLRGVLRW